MTSLVSLDEELLIQMLNQMTYNEILTWCNVSSRFRELCSDPTSIVGMTLEKKKQDMVIAEFEIEHVIANDEYGIYIKIPYSDIPLTFNPIVTIPGPYSTPGEVAEMIDVIKNKTQSIFRLRHDYDVVSARKPKTSRQDMVILYSELSNAVIVEIAEIGFKVDINADLYATILEAGLKAFNRGLEYGTVLITSDLESRLLHHVLDV